MNVMISPAVHNAIFSKPWAPAGVNLLKHYILEADVSRAGVILNSIKLHIMKGKWRLMRYTAGERVNKVGGVALKVTS